MREILFRGKSLEEDECIKKGAWIEGGLFIQEENDVKEFAAYILTPSLLRVANAHLVDPETVGQFTGLTDKNGKKVFEGDIMGGEIGGEKTAFGVVEYGEFNCSCCSGVYGWTVTRYGDIREINSDEVIGNIHDDAYLTED